MNNRVSTPISSEAPPIRTRKSGVPTGNAGEYFVMGELLRQGFDAQLADRNTKGYDVLVGHANEAKLTKVQVKSVRSPPWYVNPADFEGDLLDRITIYVLVGPEKRKTGVRYFIAKNRDLANHVHQPPGWKKHGFMSLKHVLPFEDNWTTFLE